MTLAGIDGQVSLYRLNDDKIVSQVTAFPPNKYCRCILAWDPHAAQNCAIVVTNPYEGTIRILTWDVFKEADRSAAALTEMFNIRIQVRI